MRLLRFQGSGINGYLDFDIDFYQDLTFLTGINGTGKTSALNAIASLLMPRLDHLATHEFDELSITIEEAGEITVLSAEQLAGETQLRCSKFPDQELAFEPFEDLDEFPSYRASELEEEYYKEMQDAFAKTDIMRFILNLPTPMFLGLDRRSRSLDAGKLYNRRSYLRSSKKTRNVFSSSLSGSLSEAQDFAEHTITECFRRKASLDRKFRDNLMLELLNFPMNDFQGFSKDDELLNPRKLKAAKRNIYRIPELLKVSGEEITEKLSRLFDFIEENIEIAEQPLSPEHDEEPWEAPSFRARLVLAQNRASIDKINAVSGMVSEYTKNLNSTFQKVDEFLGVVNSFILDSDKTIFYNERGFLSFRVGDEIAERELKTLSSGEIQLIVILAHLYFNPETERANVFIIDEPELSLHVQWQAKFVDALLEASERTQFIMATHSPTVIMNRVKQCVEISRK